MADGETKRMERVSERQVTMPVAALGGLLVSVVTGLVSAGTLGSSSSAAMVRLETRMESMQQDQRRVAEEWRAVILRLDGRDEGLDERLRAVELEQARSRASTPR